MKNCLVCERIRQIEEKTNKYFVAELETGYVVLGDSQFIKGYTLFLSKEHKTEIHELSIEKRSAFLMEMSYVAEAVYNAFKPHKMNYELLGNEFAHMHWHLFPRPKNDPIPNEAIWVIDREERFSKEYLPSDEELGQMREILISELNKLMLTNK